MSSQDRPKTAAGPRSVSSSSVGNTSSRTLPGSAAASGRATTGQANRTHTASSRTDDMSQQKVINSRSAGVRPGLAEAAGSQSARFQRSVERDESGRSRANLAEQAVDDAKHRRSSAAGPILDTPIPGSRTVTSRGAAISRPMTGTMDKIKVFDRPITQQGLVGQKSLPTGGTRSRMVQDKSYYLALLRVKMSQLKTETSKLKSQSDQLMQDQEAHATYKARVKQAASEMLEMQDQLSDYNMMIELMNMGSNRESIDQEYEEYKRSNESESLVVEKLYDNRKQLEDQLATIQTQLEREKHQVESTIDSMAADEREAYLSKREYYGQLKETVEQLQRQIERDLEQKVQLESSLSSSKEKQEAAELYRRLSEIEAYKREILEKKKTKETPEQERKRLLEQIKKDKKELDNLQKVKNDLSRAIDKDTDELDSLENDVESVQTEQLSKMDELKRKEHQMKEFLSKFEANRDELKRQLEMKKQELSLSRNSLEHENVAPTFSAADLLEIRNQLENKNHSKDKLSENTTKSMVNEEPQVELHKLKSLDKKLHEQKTLMEKQLLTMQEKIETYSNTDAIKVEQNEKARYLSDKKRKLQQQVEMAKENMAQLEVRRTNTTKELEGNDSFAQQEMLERRLAAIEMTRFALTEQISDKQSQSDYRDLSRRVLDAVSQENERIKALASAGKMRLSQ